MEKVTGFSSHFFCSCFDVFPTENDSVLFSINLYSQK